MNLEPLQFYPREENTKVKFPGDREGFETPVIYVYDRMGNETVPVLMLRPSYQYQILSLLNQRTVAEVHTVLNAERLGT